MKTNILTCCYFDLHGTDLGGRPSRNDHYLSSLNSIMNINNARFFIYTNDIEKVNSFYEERYPDKIGKFEVFEYNLRTTPYAQSINAIKNIEETKQSNRCIELQYAKLLWLEEYLKSSDYIYWIDAGLCYSGLIPDKYLKTNTGRYLETYYGSDYFTDNFVNNLNSFSGSKVTVCAKENVDHYWDRPLPEKYFKKDTFDSKYHIIGGLFGGKSETVKDVCLKFKDLANTLLRDKLLYHEEHILSCLFFSYPELFVSKHFDIWWHENNIVGNVGEERGKNLLASSKSFYKILEELF